ncbi:MAG: hypothetical protein WB609_04845 [Candidatus Cybelea sp.]
MKAFLTAALLAVFCACAFAPAVADQDATDFGPLSPSEEQFVASVKADLLARYAHVGDAEKAGYVRYTSPDDTGAISYANRKWTSDPTHPSQLWYDASGNLMGADFSVPRPNNEPRPQLWGVNPGRWYQFNGHVHYVVKEANGKILYDQWIWNADFAALGGNLNDPSAEIIVKAGKVPSADMIQTIFDFPTQWDLIVWLVPHREGTFHW